MPLCAAASCTFLRGAKYFPLMTVAENIAMGAYTRKDRSTISVDEEMVYSYFPILKDRRTQRAGTLSGGQQQMLAIGRGLMSQSQVDVAG